MKGLLWEMPEGEPLQEWARLARSEDVQALVALIKGQRQFLLERLADEPDNDTRTYLQGQAQALLELMVFPAECEKAIKRDTQQGETNGYGTREWLRERIRLFRL